MLPDQEAKPYPFLPKVLEERKEGCRHMAPDKCRF
jgi:hypothetical protein